MCGRYAFSLPQDAMQKFVAPLKIVLPPARYNIAPTQPIVAVWQNEGGRDAHLARWGLMPHWVRDPREFPLLINARSETMLDKPAFRTAVRHHRCVVPASGYYEWRRSPDGNKQPFYISSADGSPLAMAGLYSTWVGPEGEEIDTAAIVTVAANADLATIHDRMPALLDAEGIEAWLNVRSVRAAEAQTHVTPAPGGTTRAWPVSTRVNGTANDGVDLIEPVTEAVSGPASQKTGKVKPNNSDQMDLF